MSWRTVVISSNAKLDYQIGYLVVRGKKTIKIHLNEIQTLIIESTAVSLTAYLLSELVKNKIKVIFCDEKRNPESELVPYYGSHDTSRKIRNQIKWNDERKLQVWTMIVREKIHNQATLLQILDLEESELLFHYLDQMEFADATNREGHAAKVYFNALFGKEFTRASDHPINAALNYGYSILLSMFTREIVSNGYLTQIGLFHNNMFNQFNLASDFMEPFRPLVDEMIWNMKIKKFGIEEKHHILNMVNMEVIITDKTELLNNAVKLYTKSVFDALENGQIEKIKFYEK